MLIIRNTLIPFPGYSAITIYPFIFTRVPLTVTTLRHELIHASQQKELLVIPFFIIYIAEYLIRIVILRSHRLAYRSISFEREAYAHQSDRWYLGLRRPLAMWK